MYIIVWRNSHREPFINLNDHQFKESYSTYEQAKEDAERILEQENDNSESHWYYDYQIYEEANS